ncbi:MAG: BglII/BstYI family type II restriction endonuclease [Shimia sp.]
MFLTRTFDDPEFMPSSARAAWHFVESNSACAVLKAVCHEEWCDLVNFLETYRLVADAWLKPGGNRGDIPQQMDAMFHEMGWREARLDLETKGIIVGKDGAEREELPVSYQTGYLVDNFKGRVVLDVEWAAKDGNLDRDLAAYRAWHEAGVISAAIIVTRQRLELLQLAREIWKVHQAKLSPGQRSKKLPVDLTTSTTTAFDKAEIRVHRGVMGTCPLLIIGAGRSTWDGSYLSPG